MRDKLILSISLLLYIKTLTVHGQDIKLNILTFNPCNSTYEHEFLASLVKGDKVFSISDSLGTIYLQETGVYKLKVFGTDFYNITDSVKLITIYRGQNYDTLTRTTIIKGFSVNCIIPPPKGPSWGYLCCDNLCEGYNVDYFDNGKKKIEGHFKSGLPIGQLSFYNADGKKIEIHHYDKSGKGRLKRKEIIQ
jgi:hypothetical protein